MNEQLFFTAAGTFFLAWAFAGIVKDYVKSLKEPSDDEPDDEAPIR